MTFKNRSFSLLAILSVSWKGLIRKTTKFLDIESDIESLSH